MQSMQSQKFLGLFCLLAACWCGWTRAQDVQPQIPDYARRTTTTTTTTTTMSPSTNAIEPETTSTAAPADTTELTATSRPIYTTEALPTTTTTTTTKPITTTATPNTTTPWPVDRPTAYPWHPAPHDPHEPSAPDYWPNNCYYKQQRGTPQLEWFCGQLRWVYTWECYRCCYYEFSSFAGCYRVYNNYCGNEVK